MKTAAKSIFSSNRVFRIKINDIKMNRAQPRLSFDDNAVLSLAESIARNGLLQPLAVRKTESGYELISGERRLRALKLLGHQFAPCILVDANEQASAVLALIENLQRQDLNVFEEAEAIKKLISKWGISQSEAAERLGMSQSAVANKLRVLRLSDEDRRFIIKNGLTERHARAVLRIHNDELRFKALRHISQAGLNVEQSEKYIEKLLNLKKGKTRMVFKDLRIFTNTINMAVETMRRSGVMASATRGETDKFIEYTIRIPKPAEAVK